MFCLTSMVVQKEIELEWLGLQKSILELATFSTTSSLELTASHISHTYLASEAMESGAFECGLPKVMHIFCQDQFRETIDWFYLSKWNGLNETRRGRTSQETVQPMGRDSRDALWAALVGSVDSNAEPQCSQVTHCGRFCLPHRTSTPPFQAIKIGPRPVDLFVPS